MVPSNLQAKAKSKAQSAPAVKRPAEHLVPGASCRAAAALMVYGVEQGQSLNGLQAQLTAKLSAADKSLASEIAFGTLRHLSLLKSALHKLLSRGGRTDGKVMALLCCGLYQCALMDKLPPHAIVSSTVGACGLVGRRYAASLVNAILRRFLREGAKLPADVPAQTLYSIAPWMYRQWEKDYGKEQAKLIATATNQRAPMFLRVDTDKISAQDYLAKLQGQGISGTLGAQGLITLDKAYSTAQLPLFNEGLVSVQDKSAQNAVALLDLHDGQKVLDCCCAPGGKSAQILASGCTLQLTACDSDATRLLTAAQNLVRLQRLPAAVLPQGQKIPQRYVGEHVVLQVQDATTLDPKQGMYDRILLDAPCSCTGVIRRHPDIKWLRRAEDVAALTRLQQQILAATWACLKVGGILLYTTCSILKVENEEQIKAFLLSHPDAEQLPFELYGMTGAQCQLLPGTEGGDGFFYARLRKKA